MIKCPDVHSISNTTRFLEQFKHHINPGPPVVVLTNHKRELGLVYKFTKWSDMTPTEYEEIRLLTTTIFQLGSFYGNQKNASFLGGIMKALGWRKGYDEVDKFGIYKPFASKTLTPERYKQWKALLDKMPFVQQIMSKRYKALAPGLFSHAIEQMKQANIPGFGAQEYGDPQDTKPFAANITATWREFYNQAHIDDDVNAITYGGFCGIHEATGEPAHFSQGFDIKQGQFVLPGISTVIEFDKHDGWIDLFWASNLLFHQTVQSD